MPGKVSEEQDPISDIERECQADPEYARMVAYARACDGVYLQTCWYGWGLRSGLVSLEKGEP